jgi:hypothetical protein
VGHTASTARAPLSHLMPPEIAVLTALDDEQRVAHIAQDVHGPTTMRVAAHHQLTGRLALAVERSGGAAGALAPFARQLAETLRYNETRFIAHALPQLRELAQVMLAADIAPTVLKGSALVVAGFVPAGARPMADLDLLVPRADAPAAKRALHAAGYRSGADEETRRWAAVNHYQDAPLRHPRREFPLDLHWHVQHPRHRRPFDPDSLRRVPLQLGDDGPTVLRLHDGDLLAHLCLHFLKDREQGRPGALGQLWDVRDVAIGLDPTSWRDLAEASRHRGHVRSVAAVLGVTHLLLGLPLPTPFPEVGDLVTDQRLHSYAIRRVLAHRPQHLQLLMVTPDVEYRPGRVLARVIGHARRDPSENQAGQIRFARLHHAGSVARLALRALPVSADVRSEIALDRWSHGLR